MNDNLYDPKTDSEVWPENLDDDEFRAPESEDESGQTVPRAGLGHADAWRDHVAGEADLTLEEIKSLPDLSLPDVESHSTHDAATHDLAIVPELAPLAYPVAASEMTSSSGNGGPPGGEYSGGDFDEDGDNAPRGGEQDLWSHLGELRARILHSIAGVLLASIVTWNYGQQISEFLARPIRSTLREHKIGEMVTLDPTEGFLIYFQITLVAAIMLSAPWILFQMWRFLEPALTKSERRYSLILVPFAIVLFFGGCALGYVMSPFFFKFFVAFQPPGTVANFGYATSVALLAKMLLVFGICFQVPIVTIFLNKIGLVSRDFLIQYWRHAVVVIFIVVSIITPTWDPLSLAACAVPPCLLYGLSIWIVKWL